MKIESMKIKGEVFINLFWFVIIFFLSYRMPLFMDDYFQSKSFATGEDIKNVGMIIDSLKAAYQTFNGRTIVMFFIQIMLNLPRLVFAICNALVYVALANLLVKYIADEAVSEKWTNWILSLVFICMWFFMPDFAEVVIWPSGCITYMWMNLIILSFGYLYYKDYLDKRNENAESKTTNVVVIIGYILLGFVAGWSAEASAGAAIFGIMLYLIWSVVTKNKLGLEKWLGFVACFVGYCMLIFAPANRVRVSDAESTTVTRSFLATYGYRFARETYYMFIFLLVPIAISVALFVLARKNAVSEKENVILSICKEIAKGKEALFWLITFASIYVMTFSAGFANRIFQFPLFMLIIAMGISMVAIISRIDDKTSTRLKKAIGSLCLILMILAVTEVVAGSLYAKAHNSFFDRQMIYYNLYDTQGVLSDDSSEY